VTSDKRKIDFSNLMYGLQKNSFFVKRFCVVDSVYVVCRYRRYRPKEVPGSLGRRNKRTVRMYYIIAM
jgi:hypothetical protein